MPKDLSNKSLKYHAEGRPGKIEVIPTVSHCCQDDLAVAYSPGVAYPCLEIERDPEDAYKYTSKGNLVAVISDGTAVLGLGDIGVLASKPVMEGKGLLFKIFADIDVFDIEVNKSDVDKFVDVVKAIAPTFGGINLEDIKAPECFEIEERLKAELDIPVMHDDQHGTAIITSAGLLNAIDILGKDISKMKIVVNGAGASAISCTRLYINLGVKPENIIMLDSKGVLHVDRTDMNDVKKQFTTNKPVFTLEEAIEGADMFLGLSVAGALPKEYLMKMADNPVVFALANPVPEIGYEEAMEVRDDIIMATGRSDYPNQINNVLGFPFIFRGALDVRATTINEEMKLAAAYALAELAKQPVPEEVNLAYQAHNLSYGKEYIIPKPFDPRLITEVSPAVAKAAMDTGVARQPIEYWDMYKEELAKRLKSGSPVIRQMISRARKNPKRIVFAEAENYKILKAAEIVISEDVATPILLGRPDLVRAIIDDFKLDIPDDIEILDPRSPKMLKMREEFATDFFEKRKRRGITMDHARELMVHRNYFAPMMVSRDYADGMISGLTRSYPETIRPALQIVGKEEGTNLVSGMYIINTANGPYFFADTTVNMNPDSTDLVEITLQTVKTIRKFNMEPRVAMLSYSNFGSNKGRIPRMVSDAVAQLHKEHPDIIVDGDIQANFALNHDLLKDNFPFSKLMAGPANTFIFPYLTAGNIAYKLMQEMAGFQVIGPILSGLKRSVHVLQLGASVNEIVNMVTIAVLDAQSKPLK